MFGPKKLSSPLWPRLYAAVLVLLGLVLISATPLAALLSGSDDLEQRIQAALAARTLVQSVLSLLWGLGAVVLFGGLWWLIGRLRWSLLAAAALIVAVTLVTIAGSGRLIGAAPGLHPAQTLQLPVAGAMLPDLRSRLYAYAQKEELDFLDRSDAIARKTGRSSAVWVELRRDGHTVAVASDLLNPGRVVVELYDPPGQPRINTWKERLSTDLGRTWPDLQID